jgi:archaellum biogenesis protein FlaJ (TadC family)
MLGWLHTVLQWFGRHEEFVIVAITLSVLTFFGSIAIVTTLIARMPADYFVHRSLPDDSWRKQHPAVRIILIILKNALGLFLVVLGMILLLPGVPGQGLLTVLIGLTLLNFPGKRAFELWLVRSRPVLSAINWIRAKNHRPPLILPPRQEVIGKK